MPTSDTPLVDVVVATHRVDRPIERAVASVLDGDDDVRVTVVCHEIDAELVRQKLRDHEGPRLRIVGFHDGIASPAGPFNYGLSLADAPYSAVLGSDDRFDLGAATAWARLAERYAATVVLAPVRGPDGTIIPSPLVRPGRTHHLDAVRDRLVGRSAPLGVMRTDWIRSHSPFFVEGLSTGEDINPSDELWFTAPSVVYDPAAPAYEGGYDGSDRVSSARLPIVAGLRALEDLRDRDWFQRLPAEAHRSIAIKVLRENLLSGSAGSRRHAEDWRDGDVERLRGELRAWRRLAPTADRVLCRADRDLVDVLDDDVAAGSDVALAVERWHRETSRVRRALPRNPLRSLQRDALPRIIVDLARTRARARG